MSHTDATQQITKESVYNLYKQSVSTSTEHENNVSQIVDILGGLDNVLNVYLSHSNNITMIQNQLYQLHQLFITPYKYQQSNIDQVRSLSRLPLHADQDESHSDHDNGSFLYLLDYVNFA